MAKKGTKWDGNTDIERLYSSLEDYIRGFITEGELETSITILYELKQRYDDLRVEFMRVLKENHSHKANLNSLSHTAERLQEENASLHTTIKEKNEKIRKLIEHIT